jgi:hypothetical protein
MYNWLSPKNILININGYTTLEEYVNKQEPIHNLYELIKNDIFLLHKIKKTYLKKLTFLNENNEIDTFYDNFFKKVRERIIY